MELDPPGAAAGLGGGEEGGSQVWVAKMMLQCAEYKSACRGWRPGAIQS